MIRYCKTHEESECCGCRACELACPKNAITMHPNAEGFIYPSVDRQRCIRCGVCSRVCPMEHWWEGNEPRGIFALQHRDETILKDSSSGGAFRLLADHVLQSGGCVVGCVLRQQTQAVLMITEDPQQLKAMQGSKYVFSDTGTIFKQVKNLLECGRQVLFTGAPCQCAGVLSFLEKPYDNLVTADFLCHGMPSQQILGAYVASLEKRCGAKVYDIRFRDKSKRGWGMAFSYCYQKRGKEKKVCHIGWTDSYQYGFVSGYFNRYSCYVCPFRGSKRFTDFTFCDYWGIERYHTELVAEKGVSAIAINSETAQQMWKKLSGMCASIPTEFSWVAEENPSLTHVTIEKIPPLRQEIYGMIRRRGYEPVARKYLRAKYFIAKKLWYALPVVLTRKLQNLI